MKRRIVYKIREVATRDHFDFDKGNVKAGTVMQVFPDEFATKELALMMIQALPAKLAEIFGGDLQLDDDVRHEVVALDQLLFERPVSFLKLAC